MTAKPIRSIAAEWATFEHDVIDTDGPDAWSDFHRQSARWIFYGAFARGLQTAGEVDEEQFNAIVDEWRRFVIEIRERGERSA